MKTEYSRLLIKRSTVEGQEPTITTSDTIDNTWLNTDILPGELFLNMTDDKLYVRTNNGILLINTAEYVGSLGATYDFCEAGLKTSYIDGCSSINILEDLVIATNKGLKFDTGNTMIMKTIEIGDWNMELTSTINVAHGLSSTEWKTIREIEVIVRNNDDTVYRRLQEPDGYHNQINPSGYIDYFDNTKIVLFRKTSHSVYTETDDWNATSYNRGWITFWYTPD